MTDSEFPQEEKRRRIDLQIVLHKYSRQNKINNKNHPTPPVNDKTKPTMPK